MDVIPQLEFEIASNVDAVLHVILFAEETTLEVRLVIY